MTPPNPREALRNRLAAMLDPDSGLPDVMTADEHDALREAIAALAAQPPAVSVDEAKDAARYRWLRKHAQSVEACDDDGDTMLTWESEAEDCRDDFTLDAVIDAALNPTQDAAHGGRG